MGFPGGSDSKESACNAGDPGSIPGSGRSPGEGNGYPLRYSYLEIRMDRGAWQATVHGVTKNQTWWSNQHFHFHFFHHRYNCPDVQFKLKKATWISIYLLHKQNKLLLELQAVKHYDQNCNSFWWTNKHVWESTETFISK